MKSISLCNTFPGKFPGIFFLQLLMLFASRDAIGQQDTSAGRIYLTFDDGPYAVSYRLDSISRKDSIPITVFLVGSRVFTSITGWGLLKKFRENPFIEIANHSFSHANGKYKYSYSQPHSMSKDFELNNNLLQPGNKIARLPGRNTWRIGSRSRTDLKDANAAADSLKNEGYVLLGWDIEWLQDTTTHRCLTAMQMLNAIHHLEQSSKIFQKRNIVILCHDPMLKDSFFLEQLSLFIKMIRKENISFLELSKYPGINERSDSIHNTN